MFRNISGIFFFLSFFILSGQNQKGNQVNYSLISNAQAQSLAVSGNTVFYGDPEIDIASHITVSNLQSQSLNVICEKNN